MQAIPWFDVVQSAGIILSILFTVYTINVERKRRNVEVTLLLAQQYREIWQPLVDYEALSRVFDEKIDTAELQLSESERRFVRLIISHVRYSTILKSDDSEFMRAAQDDVGAFFSLPVPRAAWEEVRELHSKEFVTFVETAARIHRDRV